jgi:hypothetical protein
VSSWINSHTKEEASTPKSSREEGERAREAKGQSFQPVQAYGTSRERMESQTSSEPAPVRPVGGDGQTNDLETPPGFSSSVPMVCDDKSASDPAPEDDEELAT